MVSLSGTLPARLSPCEGSSASLESDRKLLFLEGKKNFWRQLWFVLEMEARMN